MNSAQKELFSPKAAPSVPITIELNGLSVDKTPFVSLVIPGRLPSWNDILGMETWQRYQFKRKLAEDFLSVLKAIEKDSSTKIICAASTSWTYSAILESYLATRQAERKLKSARKRLEQKKPSSPELKFTKSKVPF
jgi:hypothetical protein